MAREHRTLKPGVSVATVSLFKGENEDIDIQGLQHHVLRLARAGVNSITFAGSNGEGPHLTRREKNTMVQSIREALNEAGFQQLPIISNCSGQSVRDVVELCEDAHQSGADFALILPPCYYKGAYSRQDIINFYTMIGSKSPIPVIIYNYPPVVAGTDLDSDLIIQLARHKNITGCKFTCANMGKINRVAVAVDAATPKSLGSGFVAVAGLADCTIQALTSGGTGTIVGLGNVLPKSCVKLFNLWVEGKTDEAIHLQQLLASADGTLVAAGITGVKSALQTYFGYGGHPRMPLPRASQADAESWAAAIKEAVAFENAL
jgi:dihydrodipicolinate synthase/N-acetylneuraminate lyase